MNCADAEILICDYATLSSADRFELERHLADCAACAELEKLGLTHIPIIGLAKEFEEIYRPGEKEPVRLSQESGALKLLQRVRDESHRLANTYNAALRLRKISESILDEFPNIGERRKAALLKKISSSKSTKSIRSTSKRRQVRTAS